MTSKIIEGRSVTEMTISELRLKLPDVLLEAEAGGLFFIMHHGKHYGTIGQLDGMNRSTDYKVIAGNVPAPSVPGDVLTLGQD